VESKLKDYNLQTTTQQIKPSNNTDEAHMLLLAPTYIRKLNVQAECINEGKHMQSCTNGPTVHPRPLKISTDVSIRVFLEYNINTIRLSGQFAIEELL
jgi:hypothetical protein